MTFKVERIKCTSECSKIVLVYRVLASKCLKGDGYSYFNDEVLRSRLFQTL